MRVCLRIRSGDGVSNAEATWRCDGERDLGIARQQAVITEPVYHRQFGACGHIVGKPSFDLPAVLQLDMVSVSGTPFGGAPSNLGTVVVEWLPYGEGFPNAPAYDGLSPLGIQEIVASDASLGLKTSNVTFVVAYSRAIGIPRSQYRLRFTARDKNQDGQTTNVRFVDAEDTGNLGTSPVLFVTYSVPQ